MKAPYERIYRSTEKVKKLYTRHCFACKTNLASSFKRSLLLLNSEYW